MYEILRDVITSKRYELSDMLRKIDTLWIQGNLNDEQRTELVKLAQDNANPQDSMDFAKKLAELEARVEKLEQAENPAEPQPEEYPPYVMGHWYYAGDKVTFEGKRYICVAPEGAVCVWSPKDYPAYWEEAVGV